MKTIYSSVLIFLCVAFYLFNLNESRGLQKAKSEPKIISIFIFILNTARTPGVYLLNDKNQDFWDNYGGPSQLTALGKEQMHKIGQFYKNYYSNFLTPKYSPQRVYVRSIDSDRAITSIESMIYAMYPELSNNTSIQWSSKSDWVPIPIHTVDIKTDPLYPVSGSACPKFDKLRQLALQSAEYIEVEKSKKDFIDAMSLYSGIKYERYIDLWPVAENILCQIHHGFKLEPIAEKYIEDVSNVFYYTSNLLFSETMEKAKLVAGPILNDIVKKIKDRVEGISNNELTVYSLGQAQGQFYAMSKLLELWKPIRPTLGYSYSFELIEDEKDYFVRVMFKTNITSSVLPVKIDGCEELCPLNSFLKITSSKIVQDTIKECSLENSDLNSSESTRVSTKYPIVLIIFIFLSLFI